MTLLQQQVCIYVSAPVKFVAYWHNGSKCQQQICTSNLTLTLESTALKSAEHEIHLVDRRQRIISMFVFVCFAPALPF